MHKTERYDYGAQILHWLVAGLVVLQFVLARLAASAAASDSAVRQLALLANHKSVGITVLALAVIRLLWRIKSPPPQLPPSIDRRQVLVSRLSHWALYSLIILIPISGWLMSSASAYSVSWFNLFQLPDFVAPDPRLKEAFETTHETLGIALMIVVSIHVLAAAKHQFIDKNQVLRRMSSAAGLALFACVLVAGALLLGRAAWQLPPNESTAPSSSSPALDVSAVAEPPPSNYQPWQIDYEKSYIKFAGDQAGASFDGTWTNWKAELYFDENAVEAGSFDVTVYAADVDTADVDRDVTLADPEWFDVRQFPEAYYRADKFATLDDGGFIANGQLVIKGVAAAVPLKFRIETNGADRLLIGEAEMLRNDLGLGTGEWQGTDWVSNEVTVMVRVQATVLQ